MGRKKHTDHKSSSASTSTYALVVLLVGIALALGYRSWPSATHTLTSRQADQLVDRGLAHVAAGRWEAAIDEFTRSHKHCSAGRKLDVSVLLATLLTQTGRHHQALAHYRQLPVEIDKLQVVRGYGTSLAATGDDKMALAQFERACQQKQDFECFNLLGLVAGCRLQQRW